ncbi:MAG TPA: hypothetical protein VGD40_14495 [Chryseosolibacter sp.]
MSDRKKIKFKRNFSSVIELKRMLEEWSQVVFSVVYSQEYDDIIARE